MNPDIATGCFAQRSVLARKLAEIYANPLIAKTRFNLMMA